MANEICEETARRFFQFKLNIITDQMTDITREALIQFSTPMI
jgi:hypothetical protein